MSEGRSKIHGLFVALITAFDARGRVSRERQAQLVRFLISKGVDGIYPCGTTGLGPMLQIDERKGVAEATIDESSGRVPVVVQVGCADTPSTVELAKHAERAGADAVASLTPYYYKPGERAVIKHFERVAESISIPVFAYNIPQFTGNNLHPRTVAALARRGTIAGIKDSSRDVLQFLDLLGLVPEGCTVMNGTEEYALFAMMMGGDGLVSGGSNAFPELFESLVSAQPKGNYRKALSAQRKVLEFKELAKEAPIPAYYEILRERGVDCGTPRTPFLPFERHRRGALIRKLRRIGFPRAAK